ncbi:MAG: bifunctional diguanylate cyclase/phosphodiesterase [Pseudorhodoplanes sp.]
MATKATKVSRPARAFVHDRAPGAVGETASTTGGPDYAEILRSTGEAAYEWQIDSDRLTWSDNATALFGLRDRRPIASGRAYASLLDAGNATTRFDAVFHSPEVDSGAGVAYQIQYALRVGARAPKLWVEDTGRWFADEDGKPVRVHGLVRIINDRYEREQELAYLSRFDALTGEINRWHLTEQIEQTLQESTRAQTSCAFLLLAIDNLGRVNEAYGYDVADEVIGAVAKRLRGRMRAGDSLGRFSGNKFGIILRDCAPDEIGVAADRFLSVVRDDVVMTSAGPISVTATVGGVVAPRHAANVHEVLSRAQEILDRAKEKRPGSFQAYAPNVERDAMRKANIQATDSIVTALNERRIQIAYEPVADAQTREVVFHECLLRIQRPDGSLIPALDIIPVAERLGLVRLLDRRVLELVIEEMATHRDLKASLNVSASSTMDPDWWAGLEAMLYLHGHVAERLIIEITETAAIHDIDNARGFVTRVKDLGARIAIDDFGAGYTSFRNLRKLGVDMIKIDGAFVEKLARSEDDRTFVRTMIDLARGLKLKTVAEWVQNEQTAAILAAWGCDYLQGELIGRAALKRPASELREIVAGA